MLLTTDTDLSSISNGEELSLRGFLYKTDQGEWILSAEPNLKSCCVGTKSKAQSQVALSGNLDESHLQKAVTVKGNWSKEPRYQIKNAEIEVGAQWEFLWVFPLLIAAAFLFRKLRRV